VASTQSRLFHLFLRLIRKKRFLRIQLNSGRQSLFDCPEPTLTTKKRCHIQKSQVTGRNVFTLTPKNKPNTGKHILYLHGGAYIQCFNRFHWNFLAWLVDVTGCTVTTPDYPLAPHYTFKDSFEMGTALYEKLIEATVPGDFILMGDSSGGGFALALAQKMRNENMVQPNRIILLSPWLDITLANPEIDNIDSIDPFLERESLRRTGNLYAGGMDPSDYLLSPINGSLKGLGKIAVFVGSKDILVADARKLKALAEAAKISIDYYEYEGMIHAWMLLNFPESRKARQQIIDLIQLPV
jgi:epsilon-lactone hydrolase